MAFRHTIPVRHRGARLILSVSLVVGPAWFSPPNDGNSVWNAVDPTLSRPLHPIVMIRGIAEQFNNANLITKK